MNRLETALAHPTPPAAFGLAMVLVAGCGSAPRVPRTLETGAGEVHAMTVAARGAQVYECRAASDGSAGWAFIEPDAELFDPAGRHVGHHGAGPHWQAEDGSRIEGRVKARADAPSGGAIPWLLLEARSVGGRGVFDRMTSVQRINTVGGAAPPTPCSREMHGMVVRVDYRADYRLFAPRAGSAPTY